MKQKVLLLSATLLYDTVRVNIKANNTKGDVSMKKIVTILLTLILSTNLSYVSAYYPYEHFSCLSERWKIFAEYSSSGHYYDSESIEKENKYNPFQDKIIRLWVAEHYERTYYYSSHSTDKIKYEFNLDKKTYKRLNAKTIIEKHIAPDSKQEVIYKMACNLFDDNPVMNSVTNKINEIEETIDRANKIAKERSNSK